MDMIHSVGMPATSAMWGDPVRWTAIAATITANAGAGAEKAMRLFLHDGVLAGSAYPKANVSLNRPGLTGLLRTPPAGSPKAFRSWTRR